MDSSLENPMLRFKTFLLALGLMLVFAVLGVFYRWSGTPDSDLDSAEAGKRLATLDEVRAAQAKLLTDWGLSYTDPQGGHLPTIKVPDELVAKAVETLKANPGHKTESIVLGSKTFLEQQSKTPDPTAEFLKQN
jgi:hypothetical protein